MNVTRRNVIFGNPTLETYHGSVVTFSSIDDLEILDEESQEYCHRTVAICDVPPEQIPDGILHFVRNYRSAIRHLRIVIDEKDRREKCNEEENGPESFSTPKRIFSQPSSFAQEAMSILEEVSNSGEEGSRLFYVVLLSLRSADIARRLIHHLHGKPFSSFEAEVASIFLVESLEGIGYDSINLSACTYSSHIDGSTTNRLIAISTPMDDNCPVCLDTMMTSKDDPPLFTTVCNHTFHMDCLLRCEDVSCPVCRFDPSAISNSHTRCDLCGSTEGIFVCLICGAASCSSSNTLQNMTGHVSDIKTCIGCNKGYQSILSHAESHYNQTLHAYALETDTQRVWDFCGQGFVYRLIQNEEDGKLVEVSSPFHTSKERSAIPGLTDLEEEEVMHRKLECLASQYHTLLKNQLSQQRHYFSQEIERIKREHDERQVREKKAFPDLITTMKSDLNQLQQRKNTLQRKYNKVIDNITFLKSMNESIEANREPMQNEIRKLQQESKESKEKASQKLRSLEEDVRHLMYKLEGG